MRAGAMGASRALDFEFLMRIGVLPSVKHWFSPKVGTPIQEYPLLRFLTTASFRSTHKHSAKLQISPFCENSVLYFGVLHWFACFFVAINISQETSFGWLLHRFSQLIILLVAKICCQPLVCTKPNFCHFSDFSCKNGQLRPPKSKIPTAISTGLASGTICSKMVWWFGPFV